MAEPAPQPSDSQPIEGELVPTALVGAQTAAKKLGHRDRPGRPPEMTPSVVSKLIIAFNNGYNITEACLYAKISRPMYYDWLAKDDQFSYKMSEAQGSVSRKAKIIIAAAINSGDVNTAKWYLNAKDPEFSAKGQITPPEGQESTEKKLKDFMDDTDDGAYPTRTDAASQQPSAADSAESGIEVAPGPTDIS
jgi:hypothetical protein